MSTPVPTFSGEVQFRRYSDTSTQGASIVLSLADRDELSAFIGKEGKRFMAVLVEVGDDEQPVQYQPGSVVPADMVGGKLVPKIGPICQWLVMRCGEPEFWEFLNAEHPGDTEATNADTAAEVVKEVLTIESRKQIDGNRELESAFHRLIRGPYSKWLLRRGVTA